MDDLVIKLRMDRSHAEREAAAFHQAEKQRAAETAKAQAEEARKAAKAQADAAKETDKLARDAARRRADDARREAQEQARLDNRMLSETEIRERAKSEIYRKTNQQRIQEITKAHQTELDKARESEASANKMMASATTAVKSFAGQMVGLSSVSAVMNEVLAGFQRTRDAIFNSTEMMREFRETLLELAALKDRMGDTTAESLDTLELWSQTGQKRQDVIALQEGMLGIGEAAVDSGRATMEDVRKAMVQIGRLQAVQGADAGAFGHLGGLLLQTMPEGSKPEDIAAEVAGMYDIAQPGGFSSFGSAIQQYGKAMPFVQSGILSSREAMAITSAFSIAEPDQAGTRLDQLVRGTVGAMGRDRRVAAPEGVDVTGTATYLQDIGARGGMSPIEIARLIGEDVKRAQAMGDPDFNAYTYLQHQGYGNVEDLKAILGFSGILESETWDKTFVPRVEDANFGRERLAEADARMADDPLFHARQARASSEMSDMLAGMGDPETLRAIRETARARLIADKPQYKGLRKIDDLEKAAWWQFGAGGEKRLVDDEAARMLMELADREGIQYTAERDKYRADDRRTMSESEMVRVFRELGRTGVNVPGEVNQKLAEAAANLNTASSNLNRIATPPLQSAPRQPPAAP